MSLPDASKPPGVYVEIYEIHFGRRAMRSGRGTIAVYARNAIDDWFLRRITLPIYIRVHNELEVRVLGDDSRWLVLLVPHEQTIALSPGDWEALALGVQSYVRKRALANCSVLLCSPKAADAAEVAVGIAGADGVDGMYGPVWLVW